MPRSRFQLGVRAGLVARVDRLRLLRLFLFLGHGWILLWSVRIA
ncbi:MAG: hypothetical protein R3A78_14995 [Polyangiales bacterium]